MIDDRKFAELDAMARLHAYPPTVFLTTECAAVFLGCSVATLENFRRAGGGPVYDQPKADARSKKVQYQISELLAWTAKNKVGSIKEAAIRDGMVFATLADLQHEEPFWIDEIGLLCGLVNESTVSEVGDRILTHDVVWLPVIDAAAQQWADVEAHRGVAESVAAILKHTMQAINANLEGTELRAALAEG